MGDGTQLEEADGGIWHKTGSSRDVGHDAKQLETSRNWRESKVGDNRRWEVTGDGTWWETAGSASHAGQVPRTPGHPQVGEGPTAMRYPSGAPELGSGVQAPPPGKHSSRLSPMWRGPCARSGQPPMPALLTRGGRGELHDERLPAEGIGPAGLAAIVVVVASQHRDHV